MRIFKQQYKDRNGQTRKSAKWYVEFTDHLDVRRRLPGFKDRKPTEELARKLERIVSARVVNHPLESELARWIETLPAELRGRLAK